MEVGLGRKVSNISIYGLMGKVGKVFQVGPGFRGMEAIQGKYPALREGPV